jgi:hypothetical protein
MGKIDVVEVSYESAGHKAKNPPDQKARGTKLRNRFRQLAAAPEPIISPNAGVIITLPNPSGAAAARGEHTLDSAKRDMRQQALLRW